MAKVLGILQAWQAWSSHTSPSGASQDRHEAHVFTSEVCRDPSIKQDQGNDAHMAIIATDAFAVQHELTCDMDISCKEDWQCPGIASSTMSNVEVSVPLANKVIDDMEHQPRAYTCRQSTDGHI
jgi:hypothetical protein